MPMQLGVDCHVLSIDDFYLSKAKRKRLAASVHPLLAIRGVPGTHDVHRLLGLWLILLSLVFSQ